MFLVQCEYGHQHVMLFICSSILTLIIEIKPVQISKCLIGCAVNFIPKFFIPERVEQVFKISSRHFSQMLNDEAYCRRKW
jgi:hypothetical protein